MTEISNVPPKDIGVSPLFQKLSALQKSPDVLETEGQVENENTGQGAGCLLPPAEAGSPRGHLCSLSREERKGTGGIRLQHYWTKWEVLQTRVLHYHPY